MCTQTQCHQNTVIMKGIIRNYLGISLSILFIFISSFCFSRGSEKLSPLVLKAGKGKKISLVIEKTKYVYSIEFRDEASTIKIRKRINNTISPFVQIFNLTKWVNGRYEIIVYSKNKKVIQPIEITSTNLQVLNSERAEYFAPIAVYPNTKSINVFLDGRGNDIEVAIMNLQGSVVFKRIYKKKIRFKRRFDLRNLKKDTYLVKVSTSKSAFYRHIKL